MIKLCESGLLTDFMVSIRETYPGIYANGISCLKSPSTVYSYKVYYNNNLPQNLLVQDGTQFGTALTGVITHKSTGQSFNVKVVQDIHQLAMAIGYAQNIHGYTSDTMTISETSMLPFNIDTSQQPFQILATESDLYQIRMKTMTIGTDTCYIWLVRVQCFDPKFTV